MAKHVELLLLRNVENLGIVGDIVRVKPGYARNYLLPHGLAEFPTPSKVESLKEERARALAQLAMLRGERERLLEAMKDVMVTLVRSCNAKGGLYGSVTQRDIADRLEEMGYELDVRSIRLASAIRRIGEYAVPIQFDRDLRMEIAVVVEPDQPLEEREEMEFDDEGNLIEKPKEEKKERRRRGERADAEGKDKAREGEPEVRETTAEARG